MVDEAKNTKMLSLFNTLKEDDKDIVITMAESLVEKYQMNMTKKVSNNEDKGNDEHKV